jgi:hypothetical protein
MMGSFRHTMNNECGGSTSSSSSGESEDDDNDNVSRGERESNGP